MAVDYSVDTCKELGRKFTAASLHRPMRTDRFDAGDEFTYEITGLNHSNTAVVRVQIEKFVGGGFAGQVYKVKLLELTGGSIDGLNVGSCYAMKILIPPSRFSLFFRNVLYAIGFQGPFQLQVNPAAARAGAIWQKFIRRAAGIRFGSENAVVDIHATFIDSTLGSCGELSEWVDGRTWLLEVDENLDTLKIWQKGKTADPQRLGSAEYRAKHDFMAEFVKLMTDIGAHEFARQYEWSTCKSQPNCLKRSDSGDRPDAGLTAVDFRAGLALLPFLPMSPGDFKLIRNGLRRGSLVQFDRGDIEKLQTFAETNMEHFDDMSDLLDELKSSEEIYRNSLPDITHNHIRLLYDRKLWSTIFSSAVTGWKVRNLIDESAEAKLSSCKIFSTLFFIVGLIPFFGKFIRKIFTRPDWRKHYFSIVSSPDYFSRALKGRVAEKLITWHRAGRVSSDSAAKITDSLLLFVCHLPFSILPACLHKFITDSTFRKENLHFFFIRPAKLYFDPQLREQWLRDMVTQGRCKHILSEEDASAILSQINEPFIQKYLKSLAVHVCTLPVTQIVSVAIAVTYVLTHPEMPRSQSWSIGAGIIAIFQVVPISPGSICRGLYTTGLAIHDRNFKDYNIALFLSYFKYIGYLAFPIQMANHYPALARFMAGHWATDAVHFVPVFGERGALLEHWVFCLFYNWPLTIRRRMRKRAQIRSTLKPRYRHVIGYILAATAIFAAADLIYVSNFDQLPLLRDIWIFVALVPFVSGWRATLGSGGAALYKRIIAATICGLAIGLLYQAFSSLLAHGTITAGQVATGAIWRSFIFTIFATIGAITAELKLPDPDIE
jgi:hypothetical protein